MQREQARLLLANLVAAFRPREFGPLSEQLYVQALIELDHVEASRAIRWGIRDGWRHFPTIAELRAEILDDYDAPPFHSLPPATWTADDEQRAKTVMAEAMREHRERHGEHENAGPVLRTIEPDPPVLKVDTVDVERKRELARLAREALEAESS